MFYYICFKIIVLKQILILAYDFPPLVTVGGQRPYSWYKYFREYGFYPVVITRQWSNTYKNQLDYIAPGESSEAIIEKTDQGMIIRTPYHPNLANRLMIKYGSSRFKFLRRIITAWYEVVQFILPVGTKSCIYREAKKYLKDNKPDIIIATGGPFILFKYASMISRHYNIPWIADYRDAWSQDKIRHGNNLIRKWNSIFEKRFVENADLIVTVSDFIEKLVSTRIKNNRFMLVPNGYDPDSIVKISGIDQQKEKLKIAFIGSVLPWHPIRSFFKALSIFFEENKFADLEFHLIGIDIEDEVKEIIDNEFIEISDKIKLIPKVQNKELLEKLATYNALLLFNYYSIIGTKIFDYIAVNRKIIFCYSNDNEANLLRKKHLHVSEEVSVNDHPQEDLIRHTNSGIIVKNEEHLVTVLEELYSEFKEKGEIQCNSIHVEEFSRKIQTKKLADIINREVFGKSESN